MGNCPGKKKKIFPPPPPFFWGNRQCKLGGTAEIVDAARLKKMDRACFGCDALYRAHDAATRSRSTISTNLAMAVPIERAMVIIDENPASDGCSFVFGAADGTIELRT